MIRKTIQAKKIKKMKEVSPKTKFIEKSIQKWSATIFLAAILLFSSAKSAEAAAWPITDPAYKQMLEELYKKIHGIINGAMKKAAVMALNSQINVMVGGGSGGGPRFIVNWQDYLVSQPENQARNYMNDYISQMTAGKGSLSSYISAGKSAGEGFFSMSYTASLNQIAQNVINPVMLKPTYEGDPSQMFASGNFKNLGLYTSGVNNPWALNTYVDSKYNQLLEENKRRAETKAIANKGYIGVGEKNGEGLITFAGSSVGDLVANAQDLGNKILAAATDPGEMITAVVSQVMNKAMQVGFTSVQGAIQKGTTRVQARVNSGINSAVNQYGPAARFNMSTGR